MEKKWKNLKRRACIVPAQIKPEKRLAQGGDHTRDTLSSSACSTPSVCPGHYGASSHGLPSLRRPLGCVLHFFLLISCPHCKNRCPQ